jgi:rhodanese-related sulfurtransferase
VKLRKLKYAFLTIALSGLMLGTGCQAQQENQAVNPAVGTTATTGAAAVQPIAPEAAAKLMASDAALQILDVRTPEEVSLGVIKGAKMINWFDADFASRAVAALDKSKPLLVYCKVGGRSAQAANVLLKQGFSNIYNLQGGMMKWEGEGHPVQK